MDEPIERLVEEALDDELAIAAAFGDRQSEFEAPVEVAAFWANAHDASAKRAHALQGIVGAHADAEAPRRATRPGALSLSRSLLDDHAAFARAAARYSVLFEMALKRYVPELREFAPAAARACAQAALDALRLAIGATARELAADGLECRCVCPMCGLGVCGCVSVGTSEALAAWREAPSPDPEPPGFLVQPPRRGSAFASAGVRAGERVVEIDGRPVESVPDVQAAIRRHAIGDEATFTLEGADGARRTVRARHASDYAR